MADEQETRCKHENGTITEGKLFSVGKLEAYCPNCGGLWLSSDGGETWEPIPLR